ncbi:MAG: DNA polymerase III subunit epsilon [Idiomarinaceae bacterium HL-53]|nr:MAG: DNA polymerase III subunit epsilon [Idiomarinaceae bacterium HL-53]CUS47149.1 DNA polymerase-3 subunit epsilon [Idiomarinaceae bacterium HL-53]
MYLGSNDLQRAVAEPELKSPSFGGVDWQARYQALALKAKDPRLRRFYEAGVVSMETPVCNAQLMAVDFETSGLDPSKHGILSVGAVPFSLARISCARAQHWLAKPRKPLSDESVVIHGITHSQVERAPDLLDILDELLEALAGHVWVVHYRAIERNFFDVALRERIGEGIEFPVIDTMELEARFHRQKKLNFWQRLKGERPVSIRLADARSRYGLPFYRPHHALSDALATAELLQAQIQHHYSTNTPLSDLCT